MPVTGDDDRGTGGCGTREELVVGGIGADRFRQVLRRIDDLGVHHEQGCECLEVEPPVAEAQIGTDFSVLREDRCRQHQRDLAGMPRRQDSPGDTAEEQRGDQDVGIEDDLRYAR